VGSSTKDWLITSVPSLHHTIHQELTTLPEEHPTILDAVMANGLEDDSRCLREVASYHFYHFQQFCCCFLPAKIRRCNVTKTHPSAFVWESSCQTHSQQLPV